MKVDLRGLLVGGLLGVLWIVLMGILAGIAMAKFGDGQALDVNGTFELSLFLIASVVGYFGSGIIVACISKKYRLFTVIVVGIVITVWSLLPAEGMLGLKIIGSLLSLPMHYIGALTYLKRANKTRNETDGTKVPPIR